MLQKTGANSVEPASNNLNASQMQNVYILVYMQQLGANNKFDVLFAMECCCAALQEKCAEWAETSAKRTQTARIGVAHLPRDTHICKCFAA